MKKIKFWLVQIAVIAIASLIFGSPVFAGKNKARAVISADEMSHGEMTRLENANLDNGDADWKTPVVPDPDPEECPEGTEGVYPDCTAIEPSPDTCEPTFSNPCP
jgi:hypothetical protein